jgi:hypothetical protein
VVGVRIPSFMKPWDEPAWNRFYRALANDGGAVYRRVWKAATG